MHSKLFFLPVSTKGIVAETTCNDNQSEYNSISALERIYNTIYMFACVYCHWLNDISGNPGVS